MKYASKHEAKKWAMKALGHGGLVATIFTPFDEDGEIHEKDLRSIARYAVECKNDAIFCLGNVGEFFSLTLPERKRVLEIVVDEVGEDGSAQTETAAGGQQGDVDDAEERLRFAWHRTSPPSRSEG